MDVVLGRMQEQEVDQEVEKLFTTPNWLKKMGAKLKKLFSNVPNEPNVPDEPVQPTRGRD